MNSSFRLTQSSVESAEVNLSVFHWKKKVNKVSSFWVPGSATWCRREIAGPAQTRLIERQDWGRAVMGLKQVSPRRQALVSKAEGFICCIFLLDECFHIFYITVKTTFIPDCWEGRKWLRRYKRRCQNRDEKTFGNRGKHFMELPLKKRKKTSWCLFCLCFYLSFCLFSVMLFYENPSKFVPLTIITNYWVSLEQQVGFWAWKLWNGCRLQFPLYVGS